MGDDAGKIPAEPVWQLAETDFYLAAARCADGIQSAGIVIFITAQLVAGAADDFSGTANAAPAANGPTQDIRAPAG